MKIYLAAIIVIIIILFYLYTVREIYFDNNATVKISKYIAICMYINSYDNPSSIYAENSKYQLELCKKKILYYTGKQDSICIITSGASESNNLLFHGYTGGRIWVAPIEHKTSLECIKAIGGGIYTPEITLSRGDLVSHMGCNNETGDIYDLIAIGARVKTAGALFHSDIAQLFGKTETTAIYKNCDFLSISFHKLGGPVGIGALIIPAGYKLQPQIFGTQNNGLRGGTENIAACIGARISMEITFKNRQEKNNHLYALCNYFRHMLLKYRCEVAPEHFMGLGEKVAYIETFKCKRAVIFLSKNSINTILVSFINNEEGRRFCNIKFREELMAHNIKVSIGSACNTSQQGASHILHYMKLPFIVRCGVIRFSFGDSNTFSDIDEFERRCKHLLL